MSQTLHITGRHREDLIQRLTGLLNRKRIKVQDFAMSAASEQQLQFTVTIEGNQRQAEQTARQVEKLVDVQAVYHFPTSGSICRELALIRVPVSTSDRQAVLEIGKIFRARVVAMQPRAVTFEATGMSAKLDAFIELLEQYAPLDVARTGQIALARQSLERQQTAPQTAAHTAARSANVEPASQEATV